MHELIKTATPELARFLGEKLPEISTDWWQRNVLDRLSFQQQRVAQERGYSSLQQLDFAALLRVFDQNWYELSNVLGLPREGRTWLKELQTVRNKWAHLSAVSMPLSEVYRDADTLGRLLGIIKASQASLEAVEASKAAAVAVTAKPSGGTADLPQSSATTPTPMISSAGPQPAGSGISATPASLFRTGDLVAIKSNPVTIVPVIEIISSGSECRYRVFQNNAKVTYYESQLQSPAGAVNEQKTITAHELKAHLTSLQILSPSTANLFPCALAGFSLSLTSIVRS